MMLNFKIRYCKIRMVAFVHSELSLKAKRRVARYIDECPACYAEYQRVRELKRELDYRLPTFAQPKNGQLDRVWMAISSELNTRRPHRTVFQRYRASTSAAVIVLLIALLLPLTMGNSSVSRASATPPVPTNPISVATTDTPGTIRLVTAATVTSVETAGISATRLQPEAAPSATPIPVTWTGN